MLQSLTPNMRGILALMAACAVFTVGDVLLKLSAQFWPVSQVMVYRGLFAITISLLAVVAQGHLSRISLLADPLVIMRGISEGILATLYILALARMPLADLTSILLMSPLLITAFVAIVFGERTGWRRWSAIIAGFLGMLMIVQPGRDVQPAGYGFAALLGLGSMIFVVARDLITRRIPEHVPSVIIMLATTISATLAGATLGLMETWQPWHVQPMSMLAIAALLVTGASFLLIISSRGVDLSVVAPFRYSGVLFAIPPSILVFGDVPNALSLAGMAVIVASGVYLMHRERVRRLEAQRARLRP